MAYSAPKHLAAEPVQNSWTCSSFNKAGFGELNFMGADLTRLSGEVEG